MDIGEIRHKREGDDLKNCIKLWFENVVETYDSIWFAAGNVNGLFRYDLQTNVIALETFFSKEKVEQFRLFVDVCLVENKICFIPYFAHRMYVYDIQHKEMKIEEHELFEDNHFILVHKKEQYILMADFRKDIWILYDAQTSSMEIEKGFMEAVFGKDLDVSKIGFCGKGECCYISYLLSDNYFEYNLAEGVYTVLKYNHVTNAGYKFFEANHNGVWAEDQNKSICCLSENGELKNIFIDDREDKVERYVKSQIIGKYVVSYSFQGCQIRLLNLEEGKYENIAIDIEQGAKIFIARDFYYMNCNEDKVYVCANASEEFYEIDINKGGFNKYYIDIEIEKLRAYYRKNNAVLKKDRESYLFTLAEYIDEILLGDTLNVEEE